MASAEGPETKTFREFKCRQGIGDEVSRAIANKKSKRTWRKTVRAFRMYEKKLSDLFAKNVERRFVRRQPEHDEVRVGTIQHMASDEERTGKKKSIREEGRHKAHRGNHFSTC